MLYWTDSKDQKLGFMHLEVGHKSSGNSGVPNFTCIFHKVNIISRVQGDYVLNMSPGPRMSARTPTPSALWTPLGQLQRELR